MATTDTPEYARARTVEEADIPVVNLSDIGSPAGRNAIAAALVRAASDIGFFYVAGHGVDQHLCDSAMAASRRFFEMPVPVKTGHRG